MLDEWARAWAQPADKEWIRIMDVLQLDVSGRPQAWITAKEAAVLYASDGVAWTLGDAVHVMRGGIQLSLWRL